MSRANPSRPGGTFPPEESFLDGAPVHLPPLAEEIGRRHLARHPDDVEAYGAELAGEWAVHDMQWVLVWAFGDVAGLIDLDQQVDWLVRILGSREYPVQNFFDALEEAAGVVAEQVAGGEPVAARLREAATRSAGPG